MFRISASFFFLSEERGKTLQKEERNRCEQRQKIRSKSTSEFWEQVTAENAPASAILVFCFQKLGAKSPKVCYNRRKGGLKSQADRSVRKVGRRAPAGKAGNAPRRNNLFAKQM